METGHISGNSNTPRTHVIYLEQMFGFLYCHTLPPLFHVKHCRTPVRLFLCNVYKTYSECLCNLPLVIVQSMCYNEYTIRVATNANSAQVEKGVTTMKTAMTIVPKMRTVEELDRATGKIRALLTQNSKNSINACYYLGKVRSEKLYEGTYSNFAEYAEQNFELAKSRAYALADVAKLVATQNGKPLGKSIYADESGDFSATHLIALAKVDEDFVRHSLSSGDLRFDMSVKELVSTLKALQSPNSDEETATEETATEETATEETATEETATKETATKEDVPALGRNEIMYDIDLVLDAIKNERITDAIDMLFELRGAL